MNLYVFEDVLYDYTSGMVVIAAATFDRAIEIARDKYNYSENIDVIAIEPGWKKPTGIYGAQGILQEGILHECWGGS